MAKKLKEDVNLDEIDENFIISSFKTTEPQQTGGTLQAVERAKEKRERERNGDCRSTAKSS